MLTGEEEILTRKKTVTINRTRTTEETIGIKITAKALTVVAAMSLPLSNKVVAILGATGVEIPIKDPRIIIAHFSEAKVEVHSSKAIAITKE